MKTFNLADNCICCESFNLVSSPAVLMPFLAKRVYDQDPIEINSNWGMRDLKSGVSYVPGKSLQCQECGVLFLDHRFTDEQMAALYKGYRDTDYTKQRDYFEPGYALGAARDFIHKHDYIADVEARLIPYLAQKPTVLDWGGEWIEHPIFRYRDCICS